MPFGTVELTQYSYHEFLTIQYPHPTILTAIADICEAITTFATLGIFCFIAHTMIVCSVLIR